MFIGLYFISKLDTSIHSLLALPFPRGIYISMCLSNIQQYTTLFHKYLLLGSSFLFSLNLTLGLVSHVEG